MKQNVSRFAGVKSAWQTRHLKDAKPKQRPAIDNTYNNNWMRTEYVHTVRSARAAKNWHRYEADQDLYPFLEYMPSTAAEPRNEHKRLYGVTKPLDDPFWDTWMPPSDWGCKCGVQQRRNDANATEPPKDIKQPPAAMRNNPGKTGEIITEGHPMFKKLGSNSKAKIDKQQGYLERKIMREEIINNTQNKGNITIGNRNIKIKTGINKTFNSADIKEWPILNHIEYFLRNYKSIDTRLPLGNRRNLKYTHFYKLNTDKSVYAVIWETKGQEFLFHSLAYKKRGEKIKQPE